MTDKAGGRKKKNTHRPAPVQPDAQCGQSGGCSWISEHRVSILVFLISLFFILTVSNPALFMNDEWITANQLPQPDNGHQITYNEGKYGVTANVTVSAYFTTRNNVLMYPLALPLLALPLVRLFSLFSDNFRLLAILIWSVIPVLVAMVVGTYYPAYSRYRGTRILFPAVLIGLVFFLANILLYKQFPYSAADAPFEVAALVLTDQILFAILAAATYETCQMILHDNWLSLYGTFCCTACSSYVFWSATAKDHILTVTILAFIVLFFIRYLVRWNRADALVACACSGLLVWVRPELGFFISVALLLCYWYTIARTKRGTQPGLRQVIAACMPLIAIGIGAVPFFINNLIVNRNLFIPVYDRGASLTDISRITQGPGRLGEVIAATQGSDTGASMTFFEEMPRALNILFSRMFSGFTPDNLVHAPGVLLFPGNGSIGFLILCPLIIPAVLAAILWHDRLKKALDGSQRRVLLFLLVTCTGIFLAYLPNLLTLDTSSGVVPDMRYRSPAYLPAGILSFLLLTGAGLIGNGRKMLVSAGKAAVVLVPALLIVTFVVHPFGTGFIDYSAVYRYTVVAELCLVLLAICIYRRVPDKNTSLVGRFIPILIMLIVVTVLAHQFMLTFVYAFIIKFNGYPFWIPIIREGYGFFFTVNYLPTV